MSSPKLSLPRLVIGGAASGAGKTTITLALTAALRRRGLRVQCFKCGPDYLDPGYHAAASGRDCHNLDSWMMGSEAVRATFARQSQDADIALIEGVMGLFDGVSPRSDEGSTAAIAKVLDAPVLVALDASGVARTLAALALGLKTFDPHTRVGGFMANRVGSKGHLDLLRQALPGEILGGLPKSPQLKIPERHLGLQTADRRPWTTEQLAAWAELAEEYFDLDALIALARRAEPWPEEARLDREPHLAHRDAKKKRVGIARDRAFHFYYEANLALLRAAGAELVEFSPLDDKELPPDLDAIYIGGGYPELFAEELSRQEGMRQAIAAFAAGGGVVYGECGGLMYLGRSLRTFSGESYEMLGLLPVSVTMHEKLQALGYCEVELQGDSILGPAGTRFRGHQFRYSSLSEEGDVEHLYRLRRRRGGEVLSEGYAQGRVLGSYVHAHWASNPEIPRHFLEALSSSF